MMRENPYEREAVIEITDTNSALVTEGSMAGLLAARVLSDHFHQVTPLERSGTG